ncbi:hypothetical protein [Marinobacter sp. F3R08]|uniref:hypothetical protein n=1 Tax=Marinobacter sp. F3R08 TaxID=2841559 RepID=UPI001C09D666|nr:hypothetical protein [Marinobacter sp. F3R08]MBU2952289.1 hypothetical protein [Marinobacter sp. F3R08]
MMMEKLSKLSIAVALSAGLIHGCTDSTVAFEQLELMPGNSQSVSLKGTESEAVMTLRSRANEYVFAGEIAKHSATELRFEGRLQNSDQAVEQVFKLYPYYPGNIWVCDGCGSWVEISPVLMVEASSQ